MRRDSGYSSDWLERFLGVEKVAGSNPVTPTSEVRGDTNGTFGRCDAAGIRGVAQLVGRAVWDRKVAGSSPVTPTRKDRQWCKIVFTRRYATKGMKESRLAFPASGVGEPSGFQLVSLFRICDVLVQYRDMPQ